MCVNAELTTAVILVGSTEYIHVTITSDAADADPPSSVEFVFRPLGEPLGTPTWLAGEIVADGAQIRIGDYASAHPLTAGQYAVYVRATVSPERPIRYAGQLTIREG